MKFRKDMVRNDSSHYLPFPFAFACFRRIPSTALNILYDCKFRTESKTDSVLHICINISFQQVPVFLLSDQYT